MSKLTVFSSLLVASSIIAGCAENTPPAMVPDGARAPIGGASRMTEVPSVAVDPTIAKKCGLPATDQGPKFAYDSAQIRDRGEQVLDALAVCMLQGALRGQRLVLVGHADPRGSDEYNMALGEYRAQAVLRYLVGKGVPTQHVAATSRGDLDATGTDESTWRRDRRVDVKMPGGA